MCENMEDSDLQKEVNEFSFLHHHPGKKVPKHVVPEGCHPPAIKKIIIIINYIDEKHPLILPRKVAHVSSDGSDSSDKQNLLHVSSAICNGDDLGPFDHKAFTSGHPKILLHHLCSFARSCKFEIKEVYHSHYQDFILAVNDLRSLISDVNSLKSSLSSSNSVLQSIIGPLP